MLCYCYVSWPKDAGRRLRNSVTGYPYAGVVTVVLAFKCAVVFCVVLLSQLAKDAVSLLRKMLELNPEKRIKAIDALFVSQGA